METMPVVGWLNQTRAEYVMDNLKFELENRANGMQQLLQDEGYGAKTPVWDDEYKTWDIRVNFEGMTMLIMLDLEDPLFVSIVMPNFWRVETERLGAIMTALDHANKQAKGAKVYLSEGLDNSIAGMGFQYNGSGLDGRMLVRNLRMIANVAKLYVDAINDA